MSRVEQLPGRSPATAGGRPRRRPRRRRSGSPAARPRGQRRRPPARGRGPARSARGPSPSPPAARGGPRPRPGTCPRAAGRPASPPAAARPRRASPPSPAPRPAGAARRPTAPAGVPLEDALVLPAAAACAAACSTTAPWRPRPPGSPAPARGRMRRTTLCGSALGQPVAGRGRHQVVGWRAHPGELLGVLPPVGQRPEGPHVESRRRGGRRGPTATGHDGDRRSGRAAARRAGPVDRACAGQLGRRSAPAGRGGAGGDRDGNRPRAASTSGTSAACSCSATATPRRRRRCSRRAAEAEPGSRSILEALARAQYDAGRYAEAIDSFTALIAVEPDRRLRPLRPRPGREPGGRAASSPPSTWRWPWRCAPTWATTPVRCAGSGPGRRRSPRDRPRAAPARRGQLRPPAQVYDVALLDLDGVVYVGPDAVPGVPEALAAARDGRHAAGLRHQQRRPHARGGRRAPDRARRRRRRPATSSPAPRRRRRSSPSRSGPGRGSCRSAVPGSRRRCGRPA